jgi:hypothetical protein
MNIRQEGTYPSKLCPRGRRSSCSKAKMSSIVWSFCSGCARDPSSLHRSNNQTFKASRSSKFSFGVNSRRFNGAGCSGPGSQSVPSPSPMQVCKVVIVAPLVRVTMATDPSHSGSCRPKTGGGIYDLWSATHRSPWSWDCPLPDS